MKRLFCLLLTLVTFCAAAPALRAADAAPERTVTERLDDLETDSRQIRRTLRKMTDTVSNDC